MKRREVLCSLGAFGSVAIAGCQSPTGGETPTIGEREEISGITVEDMPASSSITSDRLVVVSDDIIEESDLLFPGMQMRVRLSSATDVDWPELPTVYTTTTDPDFTDEKDRTIWLSQSGRERCFATPGMEVTINPYSASPTYNSQSSAQENNEYVEKILDHNGGLLFCAPYGGNMFENTGRQAIFAGSETDRASTWAAYGYDQLGEGRNRWYVPPDVLDERSYHRLGSDISSSYSNCIMFNGTMSQEDRTKVYIGGLMNISLKEDLADKIQSVLAPIGGEIEVVSSGEFDAADPQHIANKLTVRDSSGIQITQGAAIRDGLWQEVAEATLEFVDDNVQELF